LSGQQPYWEYKQHPSLLGPCAAVVLSSQHPNCSLAHADKHSRKISDTYVKYLLNHLIIISNKTVLKLLLIL